MRCLPEFLADILPSCHPCNNLNAPLAQPAPDPAQLWTAGICTATWATSSPARTPEACGSTSLRPWSRSTSRSRSYPAPRSPTRRCTCRCSLPRLFPFAILDASLASLKEAAVAAMAQHAASLERKRSGPLCAHKIDSWSLFQLSKLVPGKKQGAFLGAQAPQSHEDPIGGGGAAVDEAQRLQPGTRRLRNAPRPPHLGEPETSLSTLAAF